MEQTSTWDGRENRDQKAALLFTLLTTLLRLASIRLDEGDSGELVGHDRVEGKGKMDWSEEGRERVDRWRGEVS